MRFYKRLQEDGSLITIKYVVIWSILFACIGALIASVKVVAFEQVNEGTSAMHKEPIYDEECMNQLSEIEYDPRSASSPTDECITGYEERIQPMGERLGGLMKLYALYAAGIGFTVGLITSEEKRKKG